MFGLIDDLLNKITMYRLILYYLTALVLFAVILSFTGQISYSWWSILLSFLLLIAVCWVSNWLFARAFGAVANLESNFITASILTLIVSPQNSAKGLLFLICVGVIAMASKYILAIHKKHLFNPAAVAVVITIFLLGQGASWWVANMYMLPMVLVGGLLLTRKIRRGAMVVTFFAAAIAGLAVAAQLEGANVTLSLKGALVDFPLVFFGFVMFTEPETTPPRKWSQIIYAIIVGLLFTPQLHIYKYFTSPEIALVMGNVYSYLASYKYRLKLVLKQKLQLAPGIYDFVFETNRKMNFTPGQYLAWTLPGTKADVRGNRRYFTIASSPTENEIRLGTKFYEPSSSFKKRLSALQSGEPVFASQLAGDFVLPNSTGEKLVFIAGGIGVTPFRSMVKYMLDNNEKRDVVMFYSTKTQAEAVYKNIFDEAVAKLGIKVLYEGVVTEEMIKQNAPDFTNRTFYISGPHVMVEAFKTTLKKLGVKKSRIKTDFFPGYA